MLSPFIDEEGVIRVGGRVNKAMVSYKAKHPALLPNKHWISHLITRQMHQYGHSGVATTAAKTRRNYWIVKVHDLAKSIKFRCVFCREMEHQVESQIMADLPKHRLAQYTPPFHYMSGDYFGPYQVKVGRNKRTKRYGVIFTSKHESSPPGARSRLFYRGVHAGTSQILLDKRPTSAHDQ